MQVERHQQAVFAPAATVLHRPGVSAADAADPASTAGAVDTGGSERVRFDLDTSGCVGLTGLTVQVLYWNALAGRYFRGAGATFSADDLAANPVPALDVEARGATAVFLKVVAAAAAALDLDIYATPW